jgi:hypothetical protein
LLIRELDLGRWLRFRYSAIVEYLMALSVARKPDLVQLDDVTTAAAESPEVSAVAVRENVMDLARSGEISFAGQARNYYASSPTYISGAVSSLRLGFGDGNKTSYEDIDAIYNNIRRMEPDNAFDAFFVIAARPNAQPGERIVDVFAAAWQINDGRPDRWKMLEKIADRGLLTHRIVLTLIGFSKIPREWEVFLGRLHERNDRQRVAQDLQLSFGSAVVPSDPAWDQARGLFELALQGRAFTPGTVFER